MYKKYMIHIIWLFSIFILTSCNSTDVDNEKDGDTKVTVYLTNIEKNKLIKEDIFIKAKSKVDMITEVIENLKSGVVGSKSLSTVPKDLKIIDVKINGSNIILNMSGDYNKMNTVDEILCRTSLVASLIELDFVETVELYVEQVPLKGSDGTPVGAIGKNGIVFDFSGQNQQENTKTITLYFSNKEGTGLVSEEIIIKQNPNENIEKTVLKLLMEGPTSDELIGTIPKETTIKDIFVREGVCYIDFSKEFKTKHPGGSTGEMLTIYSIVNSLTELPNINKVQFLIEGEKQEEFKGHLEFDVLFQRNLDIVL